MHSGTLINDLFALVDRVRAKRLRAARAHADARASDAELQSSQPHARDSQCSWESSEPKQFPQPLGLGPADRDLGLLLVVHPQLVRALEPRDHFANAVDVYQVGAVRPPEKIRV
jgi:hypothetical protein